MKYSVTVTPLFSTYTGIFPVGRMDWTFAHLQFFVLHLDEKRKTAILMAEVVFAKIIVSDTPRGVGGEKGTKHHTTEV